MVTTKQRNNPYNVLGIKVNTKYGSDAKTDSDNVPANTTSSLASKLHNETTSGVGKSSTTPYQSTLQKSKYSTSNKDKQGQAISNATPTHITSKKPINNYDWLRPPKQQPISTSSAQNTSEPPSTQPKEPIVAPKFPENKHISSLSTSSSNSSSPPVR